MNLTTSLGIHAAITADLHAPLLFPGSETFHTLFDSFTHSRLHASFTLWVALEPRCANQAFNVVNGDNQSWQNMWPKLARKFRCYIPADMSGKPAHGDEEEEEEEEEEGSVMDLAEPPPPPPPPVADVAPSLGLQGRVPRGQVQQRVDFGEAESAGGRKVSVGAAGAEGRVGEGWIGEGDVGVFGLRVGEEL